MDLREYNWDLANKLSGIQVDNKIIIPTIGQKVEIIKYPKWMDADEAVRLSKLSHLTVKDFYPLTIGQNGNYKKVYEIELNETDFNFPPDCLKLH